MIKEEYWHIDPDGEKGMAGPYETLAEAMSDALLILHDRSYRVPIIKIVKTVAVSDTKVSFETTWEASCTKVL